MTTMRFSRAQLVGAFLLLALLWALLILRLVFARA
jgi:hypothetical protein